MNKHPELGSNLSEQDFNALLTALGSTALVSMTDVKGNILYINDTFVKVSKYKREELIGQNHRILKSGHQPQEIFDDLWGTISDGRTWRGEIENKAKDGSFYWVDTTITPILNAQYVSTGYMAVRFLITDKKEAELKLQKAFGDIQKFMLAVERSYETTVITDTNGIIQYVNPAFTKLTGYTAKEAIGKNPRVLQSGKTPKAVYENMWSLIANGESFVSDELVNKRKDGSEYYADIAIYPVMEGGKPQFFVAIQRDVTQRKKEERAKAEFVSIASHQLRTPLTAIRWSLGRFSKNLPDNIDDPSKTLLDAAMNASKRMGETINAMLNMSRLAAGKIAPTITDVHFNTLLKEMCHELEPQYTAKHITVDIQCSEEWSLRTDEKLLKEIINNLLTNAIKYTPPQGKISIGIRKDDPLLIIDIADNGYGIPKAQQENIFSKFFRADNVLDK
ncbi:MAG: PAS domain-containing sensor histidine kinase, partial [Candidatus Peregrinibacteria bacterium]|nr:PAS domain-containing sensor histidine kinase [Candidatus Peregrinibacteria bacterium]